MICNKLFSLSSSDNHEVFKSLATNLDMTSSPMRRNNSMKNITFLQICAIRISKASWGCIGKAISNNNSIKTLALNACRVNNNAFAHLVPAMEKNKSIEILDLSCNYMGDKMSTFISKIIALQSKRREQAIWLAGFREELPEEEEYKSGLKSLILRHNDFSKDVCSEISRVLYFDIYIRSIDLRNNLLQEEEIQEMKYFLKSNKALINLYVLKNKGLTTKLHRMVVLKLLRNIEYTKKTNIEDMRWMNPEVLICEIPKYLAPKIQRKMNKLFEHPSQARRPKATVVRRSVNYYNNIKTIAMPVPDYLKVAKTPGVDNLKQRLPLAEYHYSQMQNRESSMYEKAQSHTSLRARSYSLKSPYIFKN
ncbi:unnamed protein product [Moneuplotes crassus]|uniref:Uncharacterized protein n=1 Tax=Euplotes crassus TaxID=5936 RepID=A0AAD1X777_EUPCR|nr:unnamed protein product [Moneuplotes crassus]